MRMQLIKASIGTLDGVIYTHSHADHVNGIDDLRMVAINRKKRVPVWADNKTRVRLEKSFDYVFKQLSGSKYPPILDLNPIVGTTEVEGPGGIITFQALPVNHGEIDALGFRIGNLAYIPDVLEIYEDTWPLLSNLSYLVIDALRYSPHPSHTHGASSVSVPVGRTSPLEPRPSPPALSLRSSSMIPASGPRGYATAHASTELLVILIPIRGIDIQFK